MGVLIVLANFPDSGHMNGLSQIEWRAFYRLAALFGLSCAWEHCGNFQITQKFWNIETRQKPVKFDLMISLQSCKVLEISKGICGSQHQFLNRRSRPSYHIRWVFIEHVTTNPSLHSQPTAYHQYSNTGTKLGGTIEYGDRCWNPLRGQDICTKKHCDGSTTNMKSSRTVLNFQT